MKKIFLSLIGLLLLVQPILADDVDDVRNLVSDKIATIVDLIRDTNLSAEDKNQRVVDTVSPFFDFNLMAKLSLGSTYWKQLSPSQRDEFIEVFVTYLQRFFIGSLEQYSNEEVKVAKAERAGKRIHVTTELISGGEYMELDFKFYRSKSGWLVYDIDILGVSIIHSKNSEIDDKMKREGYDGLIKYFREASGI